MVCKITPVSSRREIDSRHFTTGNCSEPKPTNQKDTIEDNPMTQQSQSPQPPSSVPSPKTTEVMVILTARQGVTRQQIMNIMPAEIRATVKLYLDGKIRQWYSRGDGRGVI